MGEGRETENLVCPFCAEQGFDGYGLKVHLLRGWCEVFEAVGPDSPPVEQMHPTPTHQGERK